MTGFVLKYKDTYLTHSGYPVEEIENAHIFHLLKSARTRRTYLKNYYSRYLLNNSINPDEIKIFAIEITFTELEEI